MNPEDPVTVLPFVGEKSAKLLKNLEINTLEDLLHHYPSRYQDYSLISTIAKLQPGETLTVVGSVIAFRNRVTRKRRLTIQEATLQDSTGELELLWFNQPFLSNLIKPRVNAAVAGTVERDGSRLILKNPEYEILKKGPTFKGWTFRTQLIHTGRLVPVYPETKGVSSKWLRAKIALITGALNWYGERYNLLDGSSSPGRTVLEWLPRSVLKKNGLVGLTEALKNVHFPQSKSKLDRARKRLGFDELLLLQLEAQQRKRRWQTRGQARQIKDGESLKDYRDQLPFKLTDDQERAIAEILADFEKSFPMNRLLQGDVGSGKTVVAAAAAYVAIKAGYQAAFMAPTQVLADQHAGTLTELLKPLGVSVGLLTGARHQSQNSKVKIHQSKVPDLIIGTHALIHRRAGKLIDKNRLAVVIIDEQHRFGVSQRAELIEQGGSPHVLSMTATPIPRTVALSCYADLAISTIKQLPRGRLKIKTWVVPETKREKAYHWIEKQIGENQAQVLVVCPLIEQSDHESMKSVKAAAAEFEALQKRFKKLKLALLHGRLKARSKTGVLREMVKGKLDILVTTPVVEVGVDIPGATIMLVEAAHRFGLAQLHQLRGRVGRAEKQSYCLLFSETAEVKRLKALETTNDGLRLAQLDLKWRGPGELFSTKQHGFPKLKIADLSQMSAIQQAYRTAVELIDRGEEFPKIREKIKTLVEKKVAPN